MEITMTEVCLSVFYGHLLTEVGFIHVNSVYNVCVHQIRSYQVTETVKHDCSNKHKILLSVIYGCRLAYEFECDIGRGQAFACSFTC